MSTPAIVLAPSDLSSATLDRWVAAIARVDAVGWPMMLLEAADAGDPLDGLAFAAFLATRTTRIWLCASIDPAIVEPFTLARGLATLDHLSGGRAAWRLVGGDPARTAELADVVAKLLLSWGEEALIEDRENGLLSDADAVRAIDHAGSFFSVRGPLNIPRPPQGVPPLVALPGDATADRADLLPDNRSVLRCSIDEASALPARPGMAT